MKDIEGNYLIAVSGGPDSMALLDMARDKGLVKAVAHVNYHHRPTANRDEKIVRTYCEKYGIVFYKLDVKKYSGNFQDYARVVRYKFFKKIVKKEKLDGVLIAHHKDDLLETYLLQKKRGSIPEYYGLNEKTTIQDIKVIRPLLSFTKKELEAYCINKSIVYGIDESNLRDDYSRNVIRHSLIEKMTDEEKDQLYEEIIELNNASKAEILKIESFLKNRTKIDYEEYCNCVFKEKVLRYLIDEDISSKYLNELIRQLKESDNLCLSIKNQYLVKEYGYIEVFTKPKDYSYTLYKYKNMRNKYFKISKKGSSLEALSLSEEDYPLTIRNVKEGDYIKLRFGKKKLNRFFIDNKISTRERLSYPVVTNSKGEVILVPGIGCDVNHYSKKATMFCGRII